MQNGKDRGKGTTCGLGAAKCFPTHPSTRARSDVSVRSPSEGSACGRLRAGAAHLAARRPPDTRHGHRHAAGSLSPTSAVTWGDATARAPPAPRNDFPSAKVRHGAPRRVRGGGAAPSAARNPVRREMLGKKQSVGRSPVEFLHGGTVTCGTTASVTLAGQMARPAVIPRGQCHRPSGVSREVPFIPAIPGPRVGMPILPGSRLPRV